MFLALEEYTPGNAEEEQHVQWSQVVWVLTTLEQVQNNKKLGCIATSKLREMQMHSIKTVLENNEIHESR